MAIFVHNQNVGQNFLQFWQEIEVAAAPADADFVNWAQVFEHEFSLVFVADRRPAFKLKYRFIRADTDKKKCGFAVGFMRENASSLIILRVAGISGGCSEM